VKTTKTLVREQERTDRVKQKVRASGQQQSVDQKPTSDSDPGSRISKIESDLAKMSTNMNKNKQCEELQRLISQKQRTTQELPNHSRGANKPSVTVPHQSEKTVTPRTEKPTSPMTASQPVGNTYSNIRHGLPSYPISPHFYRVNYWLFDSRSRSAKGMCATGGNCGDNGGFEFGCTE